MLKHKNYNFDKRSLLCWEKALGDVSCNVFAKCIYMRHIPSVHIFSTNFSLRMFLVCYFSSIFQPSCSYKVCSYKKNVYVGNGGHIYLQKKWIKIFYLTILIVCGCLGSAQPSPESCLTISSFRPSCLLTGCLLKKKECSEF